MSPSSISGVGHEPFTRPPTPTLSRSRRLLPSFVRDARALKVDKPSDSAAAGCTDFSITQKNVRISIRIHAKHGFYSDSTFISVVRQQYARQTWFLPRLHSKFKIYARFERNSSDSLTFCACAKMCETLFAYILYVYIYTLYGH